MNGGRRVGVRIGGHSNGVEKQLFFKRDPDVRFLDRLTAPASQESRGIEVSIMHAVLQGEDDSAHRRGGLQHRSLHSFGLESERAALNPENAPIRHGR